MLFHAIAVLSGGRQKTLPNCSEAEMLSDIVIPVVVNGVLTVRWGKKTQTYQVLELKIYETDKRWDKRTGPLANLTKGKRNVFFKFEARAKKILSTNKPKVFVVMPIQGDKYGDQDMQRIHKEFDERFEAIESLIASEGAVAIRIDKEHALEDLVGRIKKEIKMSTFVIADLTDERPSCYFEAGYAEALGRPVIYVASKQSIIKPGVSTKVHFDIHMNVNYFSNHLELREKLTSTIQSNREKLFPNSDKSQA